MLAVSFATQGFVAPTVHVQPVARANVQMMAPEMPSRRAALLSAASVLAVPFAVQAKPEDYAGGYTDKEYLKTYKKNPDKGGACPAPGGPSCQVPGGNPKDPLIFRSGPFDKIDKPIPLVTTSWANAKAPEEKKE